MTISTPSRQTTRLESTGEVLERETAWPCPTKAGLRNTRTRLRWQ